MDRRGARVAVFGEGDDALRKGLDVDEVDGADVLPHASLCRLQHRLRRVFVSCRHLT